MYNRYRYGNRRIVLWKGTSVEQGIWMLGQGGRLIEGHLGDNKVIILKIALTDRKNIRRL